MRISDHLSIESISTELPASTKEGTLRSLAELLARQAGNLSAEDAYRVLLERESLSTTGIGSGVALPHARADVPEFSIGLGICREGCEFDAVDGEPTRIFVAVLAPRALPGRQLKMLARISQLLRDASVRERLVAAPDREAALTVLLEQDSD